MAVAASPSQDPTQRRVSQPKPAGPAKLLGHSAFGWRQEWRARKHGSHPNAGRWKPLGRGGTRRRPRDPPRLSCCFRPRNPVDPETRATALSPLGETYLDKGLNVRTKALRGLGGSHTK
ncbi:uncharacterized protein [Symphalangus syndactylus]|uniref:uncharacterized protein n=1 Tax=Symphalangus syndactylus TaxID=9590 RepID=UPI0030055482